MKKPLFKLTPVADIKPGDRITIRVKWHISGWCPVISVVKRDSFWLSGADVVNFNGSDDNGVTRLIGIKSTDFVWREVPQCSR